MIEAKGQHLFEDQIGQLIFHALDCGLPESEPPAHVLNLDFIDRTREDKDELGAFVFSKVPDNAILIATLQPVLLYPHPANRRSQSNVRTVQFDQDVPMPLRDGFQFEPSLDNEPMRKWILILSVHAQR